MRILAQIAFGLVLGYLAGSLTESSLHRLIKHAGRRGRSFWARFPRLCEPFRRAYYSHHIVHHALTFRQDFVTQFRNEDERRALDQRLTGTFGELIRREQYGLTLRGWGIVAFNLPLLPILLLIPAVLGPWVFLGSLPGLAAYSSITIFLHPYLHQRHDDAIGAAPRVIAWLLRTRYVKAAARNHYLHHRYLNCNYNLLLGGDYLLRQHRSPSDDDLAEMKKLGVPVV